MTPPSAVLRRLGGAALFLAVVCLLAGCGKRFGSVSGNVTYKGKALNMGTVAFIPEAKGAEVATGEIDKDGKYSVPKVLVGKCKVTVSTPTALPRVPGAGGRMMDASKMGGGKEGTAKVAGTAETPAVKVPDKFSQPDTTTLTAELKEGSNTHNITITD
jgi:hypothetical protein